MCYRCIFTIHICVYMYIFVNYLDNLLITIISIIIYLSVSILCLLCKHIIIKTDFKRCSIMFEKLLKTRFLKSLDEIFILFLSIPFVKKDLRSFLALSLLILNRPHVIPLPFCISKVILCILRLLVGGKV